MSSVEHAESESDDASQALLPDDPTETCLTVDNSTMSPACSGTKTDSKFSQTISVVMSSDAAMMDCSTTFENVTVSGMRAKARVENRAIEGIEMEGLRANQPSTPACNANQRCLSTGVLSSVSDGAICRICHDGEEKEDLLSPCHCTGTVGLLHLTCLEKWLGSSNRTKCELCGFEYTVDSQPKPFIEWLRHPASRTDRRNLVCDVACFFLLTPLATISSWLCLVGARYYSHWVGRWEVPGLISLTVFLMCIYLTWCLVVTRYHYHVWRDWKAHNQVVRIRAVKKGTVVNRSLKRVTANLMLVSRRDSQGRSSRSPERMTSSESNNNNCDCHGTGGIDDEDVVVEVSSGPGQRGSYRLLSDSNVLVCSPTKLSRRHNSTTSPNSKLISRSSGRRPTTDQHSHHDDSTCLPLRPSYRDTSTSVSRSLLSDPAFCEETSSLPCPSSVNYNHSFRDILSSVVPFSALPDSQDRTGLMETYV